MLRIPSERIWYQQSGSRRSTSRDEPPPRESQQLLFGSIDHKYETEEVNADDCNPSLDPDVKQTYLSVLAHRLPTLPQSGTVVGYSSMYTVNQVCAHKKHP